jgi:aspartate ammonia-lyase
LRAHVSNIIKICNDLRLLSLLGEILLEKVQTGSSIIPGKVNPVILECAVQGALKADAELGMVFECSSRGSLQINEFMPLLADSILSAMDLLSNINVMLAGHIREIKAEKETCDKYFRENPFIITALLPEIGYLKAEELIKEFGLCGRKDIRAFLAEKLGQETVDRAFSPENLMSMGYREYGKSS